MKVLLDTHFLLWTVLDVPRLAEFPWLDRYRPWGISPVSFLEVKFLHEVGKLEVRHREFAEAVSGDPRFSVDDPPFAGLVERTMEVDWTRDPFDRLLAAHSLVRRVPLCTVDRRIREHHRLVTPESRPPSRPDAGDDPPRQFQRE